MKAIIVFLILISGGPLVYADDFAQAQCRPSLQSLVDEAPLMKLLETFPLAESHALRRLEAAGFRCQPFSVVHGISCLGKIKEYPEQIALIIPPYYQPKKSANVVIYLHGNNGDREQLASYLPRLKLREAMASSGRNAVMVFPVSMPGQGSPTAEYDFILSHKLKFDNFMQGLALLISGAGLSEQPHIAKLTVAAASGGYRALSAIISEDHSHKDRITEVYCLDCMYSNHDAFVGFAKKPGRRMWTVFSKMGGTPKVVAQAQVELKNSGVAYYGCQADKNQQTLLKSCAGLNRRIADIGGLHGQPVGFIYTETGHSDVPLEYLPKLLKRVPK